MGLKEQDESIRIGWWWWWQHLKFIYQLPDFPAGSDSEASAYYAGDLCWIPGSGRSSGEGNGTPFQYSCLENPMEGGAQETTVHGVTKTGTRLSDFTFTFLSCLPSVLCLEETKIPGVCDGQGGLACCDSWGAESRTRLSDWTELTEDWESWSNLVTATK